MFIQSKFSKLKSIHQFKRKQYTKPPKKLLICFVTKNKKLPCLLTT